MAVIQVISVSLSSNRLRSLQSIATLAEYMPNLQNLSLQDNNITTFNDLEPLAGKFHHLNELVLNDNPVKTRDLERHGNDVTYRRLVPIQFCGMK
jgi:nuclear RNA export factor